MPVAAVDFETYYDKEVSIKTLGNYAYTHHEKFDPYLVSIRTNSGHPEHDFDGHPEDYEHWDTILSQGWEWVAHNAAFDSSVFRVLPKYGRWPEGVEHRWPPVWHCTADMLAYLSVPRSLQQGVKILLKKSISKQTRSNMSGKRWEDMTPEFQQEVLEYAGDDAIYCLALWEGFSDRWPEHERWISQETRAMNGRGMPIDWDLVAEGRKKLEAANHEAFMKIPWAVAGEKPLSRKQYFLKCEEVNIEPSSSLAKDSEEFAEWLEKYGEEYPWAKAMGEYRATNTFLSRARAMETRRRADGLMDFGIMYHAAHTGRDGSGGGINLLNTPSKDVYGVNFRKMIKAPPGKKLVVVDSSAIEPTVMAWLSGDHQLLRLLREGQDIYEAHARLSMGYTDPRPLKEVDSELRRMAKIRVLGLGYGAGAETLQKVAAGYGVELTLEEAEEIKSDFRETNPCIRQLWYSLEDGIRASIDAGDKNHALQLPSGKLMVFRSPKTIMEHSDPDDPDSPLREKIVARICASGQGGAFKRVYLYGAKLTENLVQATARELHFYAVMLMRQAAVDIRLRVYDEVVAVADEDKAEDVLATIGRSLTTVPSWMPNIPLKAEGVICDEYSKP